MAHPHACASCNRTQTMFTTWWRSGALDTVLAPSPRILRCFSRGPRPHMWTLFRWSARRIQCVDGWWCRRDAATRASSTRTGTSRCWTIRCSTTGLPCRGRRGRRFPISPRPQHGCMRAAFARVLLACLSSEKNQCVEPRSNMVMWFKTSMILVEIFGDVVKLTVSV